MGFGLHSAGVIVTSAAAAAAAAAATGGGGGGGDAAAAIVGKILLHNFRKYFEYTRFRPVATSKSTDLPTILHTLLVITLICQALVLHHLPSPNR
jgi:hypothetical protein